MKGYKKITFKMLLSFYDKTKIFILLNEILKYRQKYNIWVGKWSKTGISKELFEYSANDYDYQYDLLNATLTDLELLMYRFLHKDSMQLNKFRKEEFKKEFKNKYFYLKTHGDTINDKIIEKIKKLETKEICYIEDDNKYFFNKIKLVTIGYGFYISYDVIYETEIDNEKCIGRYSGESIKIKDNEKLSDFLDRGYNWLNSLLV